MDYKSMSPQNTYDETLCYTVMVLESKAFGRWLGYKGGSLMNKVSALIKETP